MTALGFAELGGILCEGAVDRFCGRPRERNPWTEETVPEAWEAWNWGWDEADILLEERGQAEASRWLREAA